MANPIDPGLSQALATSFNKPQNAAPTASPGDPSAEGASPGFLSKLLNYFKPGPDPYQNTAESLTNNRYIK